LIDLLAFSQLFPLKVIQGEKKRRPTPGDKLPKIQRGQKGEILYRADEFIDEFNKQQQLAKQPKSKADFHFAILIAVMNRKLPKRSSPEKNQFVGAFNNFINVLQIRVTQTFLDLLILS